MATQPRRSGSDVPTAPAPFSYAQAAKGLSNAAASAAASSKPSSGSITPSKDVTVPPATTAAASIPSWADDVDAEDVRTEKQISPREPRTQVAPALKQASTQNPNPTSGISSPDLGASSTSTAVKEDDTASLQNGSAESTSTWENKSQASTSVEKTSETVEKTSEKASEKGSEKTFENTPEKTKGKNAEKTLFTPLTEAAPPAVNPWTRRADELKAKVAQKTATTKPANPPPTPVLVNGAPQGPSSSKVKGVTSVGPADAKEKSVSVDAKHKPYDDEKGAASKKEARAEVDPERNKKGPKGRSQEKDAKVASAMLPLPPDRDQESWPTPVSAVDEEKKKGQGRGDKNEKERKESSSNRPHGKQGWVTVPYTPTVVFSTPLPNTSTSRRGGRGGGRGGAQNNGRGGGFHASGASSFEKDASAPTTGANSEPPRRGRPDASAARDVSTKDKRTGSDGPTTSKEVKVPPSMAEKASRSAAMPEAEPFQPRMSVTGDGYGGPQTSGQSNTFPRQYSSTRPNKGRRGELPALGDRRKDNESGSPTKETLGSHDRRSSAATQTDVPEEDRRAGAYSESQNGQSKPGVNERRPFGSFPGRERGRGGRGSRGGYQNGHHQFANGHSPALQSSSTFPLRSPTSFHPDQGAYFPSAPAHGRCFRNGPRSQSVTTDNIYGRVPGYPGGPQQMPSIQTYMGGMYEYPMAHPMSAVPFSPYGVDQMTLLAMVTTQLEYYFSVENLCKDIFLRKHMDSKGFVHLSFIADFNRIKHLTTDLELIKYVCYQSRIIEFRVGVDGKDRLRRREGWEQWVLVLSERDPSAQNDGPEELHNPPIPHPNGFEHAPLPPYPGMPAGSPTGSAPYPVMNGVHPGSLHEPSTSTSDNHMNGPATEGVNGFVGPNGHALDTTKAVSGEPDSFSDEQVETLSVIVRKQDQSHTPMIPHSATRTFSNGSIDSKSDVPDEPGKIDGRHSSRKVNGISPSQGSEHKPQTGPRRPLSPFNLSSSPPANPVRLYWVKGKDAPVESIPSDSTYESYTHLRFKALEQRQNAIPGSCPYDMDVLYQFWSHFLIRNFNLHMYQEFQQLALEDSADGMSDVGVTNLLKYYGECLLSCQNVIRECVARDYVELVKSERESQGLAFHQLRSALRNGALDPNSRKRISEFLDADLKASLE